MTTTGTMVLTTVSAAALFEHEIKGQMSDGYWENAQPSDHWKFWCNLDVQVGLENEVQAEPQWGQKTSYGLERLIEHVGDRMVAHGRLAKALGRVPTDDEARLVEYIGKPTPSWAEGYPQLTSEQVELFQQTTYTEKDLRGDLRLIKKAIKTVKR